MLRLFLGDGTANNPFRVWLWKRDDPATRRYFELPLADTKAEWLNQSWRLSNWVAATGNGNQVLLDNYFALKGASASVWSYRYDRAGNTLALALRASAVQV